MKPSKLEQRIESLDWERLTGEVLDNGFAITESFLQAEECEDLKRYYGEDAHFRSTIDMQRHGFGRGKYRYFKYPLPPIVQTLREMLYEKLAPTANRWSERLKLELKYPRTLATFLKIMRENGQTRPTPLVLRYGEGDFNCLHQDINNDIVFPYQTVLGLSEIGNDYEGGQLILTQQRPRMQTVPHIITIPKGAGVILTSNFHPQLGARGYYRTVFKHGVGKIVSGERYTMGVVFHDYRDLTPA